MEVTLCRTPSTVKKWNTLRYPHIYIKVYVNTSYSDFFIHVFEWIKYYNIEVSPFSFTSFKVAKYNVSTRLRNAFMWMEFSKLLFNIYKLIPSFCSHWLLPFCSMDVWSKSKSQLFISNSARLFIILLLKTNMSWCFSFTANRSIIFLAV